MSDAIGITNTAPIHEVVQLLPVPFIQTDKLRKIINFNQSAKDIFGERINIERHTELTSLVVGKVGQFLLWLASKSAEPFEVELRCRGIPKRFVMYQCASGDPLNSFNFLALPISGLHFIDDDINVYRMAYDFSLNPIYLTDAKQVITAANPALISFFGRSYEKVIHKPDHALYAEFSIEEHTAMLKEVTLERNHIKRRLTCVVDEVDHASELRVCDVTIICIENELTKNVQFLHIIQNMTEQSEFERKLEERANIDPLTGLMNRGAFNDSYAEIFASGQRRGECVSLFYIDLDKFKYINDHYGHHIGDLLLKSMSKRIAACFKETDFVARLGGDEFAVLLCGDLSRKTLSMLAQKLLTSLAQAYSFDNVSLTCTCSVGIATYPTDALTEKELLKVADSAMYNAKRSGRNQFCFFDLAEQKQLNKRNETFNEIQTALENGYIKAHYQPVHDMQSGEVISFEALARYEAPNGEIQLPGYFLSLIEQTPLMVNFGIDMVKQVWHQLETHRYKRIHVPISLNFSSFQLRSEEIIHYLLFIAKRSPHIVAVMKIEITETLIFENDDIVAENIKKLIDAGFMLILDDFGTGHSSIYSLKKFKFDAVKIDKIFINEILEDKRENRSLLNSIIAMIKTLNITMICEGVEDKKQVDYLLSKESYFGQGYYFSKAIPKDVLVEYINRYSLQ